MILSFQQLSDIIKTNPNKDLIDKAKAKSKELRLHLYGDDLAASITKIDGLEKDSISALRKKYSKSNKDLFERIGRPIDKVFTALGGSVYYNLSDAQNKQATVYATNVRNGYALKKWIENFWKPHFLDDPNGFIMLEIDGAGNMYPTYKSVGSVYDYLPSGSSLEYVIFRLSNDDKKVAKLDVGSTFFRVIDDAMDYFVKQDGETITVLPSSIYKNFFGKVPAMLNSDLVSPNYQGLALSLFDGIIELAADFMQQASVKKVHNYLHGFPKYWEYADGCNNCAGTGYKGAEECTDCKGTGKKLMSKVSDSKYIAYPESKDDPIITPNVAGYISPDKTYHEIATADLSNLEDQMMFTVWGSVLSKNNTVEKTATQVFVDVQPVNDALSKISDMAERRHKFIIDHFIRLKLNQSYQGASISYGRRFIIEGADAVWDKYSTAREKGSPVSVLDELLIEYFEAKYQTDPVGLAIAKKLMYVEPFVHNTIIDVTGFSIESFEKLQKSFYGEWLSIQEDSYLFISTVDELKNSLKKYTIDKSNEDNTSKDNTPLAVKLGVGGTQSLQLILSDPNINNQSKQNTLVILFGISEEDAKLMTESSKPAPAPQPSFQ